MSLLWKSAVDAAQHPWGEPTEDYVRQTAHDYLRAHYDDPEWNDAATVADKSIHDHFRPLPHLGEEAYTQEMARSSCPSATECRHEPTMRKVREIAQNNWTAEHRELLDPEEHARIMRDLHERVNQFAWNLNAEHPGVATVVDSKTGEEDPRDADPRVQGY